MKKKILALVLALVVVFAALIGADFLQTDGGRVLVSTGYLQSGEAKLAYKLYEPKTATPDTTAPGVLLLHGYQNDHETCAAYAIELAKRGAVVLAIDELGHGWTDTGMLERGYVNHKVTVNYGEDSKEDGTFTEIGGQLRYKVLMNFSNLSFFNDYYTKDDDGNVLKNSAMGGIYAYDVLSKMPNVDETRLVVSGHSMGTWASWSVAAAYSGAKSESGADIAPKAVVLQCGELFRKSAYDSENIHFNNVLLLQAEFDEFSYFRDYKPVVDDELVKSDLRTEFLGCSAEKAAYNTTFGNFADGSARRIQYLETNHRLATHDSDGLNAALVWINDTVSLPNMMDSTRQTAMFKEVLVLVAMLAALFAMLPLMELLLGLKFFEDLKQPLPSEHTVKGTGSWIKGALTTVLIAGATYPFMTQLGHGLLPLPESVFRMTVGNGFLSWYGILILIMIGFTVVGRISQKKKGLAYSYHEAGLGTADAPEKLSWKLPGKGALMATIMCLFLYGIVALSEFLFKLDLRFIWPFFKTFTLARLGQFGVYILIFCLFYILNNSKIFAGMRTKAVYKPGIGGFLSAWWRYALVMVGGILLVALIEYIPFFAGYGPGADLLFGSTFGGPFMSLLILFAPQVLVYSLLCTYIYRRTGSIYTGAFLVAILSCWIVTGGSAML